MKTNQGNNTMNNFSNVEEALKHYAALPYHIILEKWNEENREYWVARVAELPHCMIDGATAEEAVREIEEVKLDWLRSCLERGVKIPLPVPDEFSGQIRLRIPPSIHKQLSNLASLEHVSLNQLMSNILAEAVGHKLRA
jgi:antitoxin HicB